MNLDLRWHFAPRLVFGLNLLFIASSLYAESSFQVKTVALAGAFSGFASLNSSGDVVFRTPGNIWLNELNEANVIARENRDNFLGPGLGPGIFYGSFRQEPFLSDSGDILFDSLLSGLGIDDTNALLYTRRRGGVNVPIAREGVTNQLGPGLGDQVRFKYLGFGSMNDQGDVAIWGRVEGPNFDSTNSAGIWLNTSDANVLIAQAGVGGALGPGLGNDFVFAPDPDTFRNWQALDGAGGTVFAGFVANRQSGALKLGVWKNQGAGNVPVALSGETGNLGPGVGGLTFGTGGELPLYNLEIDANTRGDLVFPATLSNNRRGIWRNLGAGNEAVMVVGETGALGPGLGLTETFADFTTSTLLPEPVINDSDDVLFPGLLANSYKQGLWLNEGSNNRAIALAGNDGELGPGLGPGVYFTGFNRAYFGDDQTIYFTADLNLNISFNRLLGMWAYRNGHIQKIAVYGEPFDVDSTSGVDERLIRYIQIPSDSYAISSDETGANLSNQVTFLIGFQDGRQGIFLGQFVPEPGAGALVLALILTLTSVGGRQKRCRF